MITPKMLANFTDADTLLSALSQNYIVDENTYMDSLLATINQDDKHLDTLKSDVEGLITTVRKTAGRGSGIDNFLQEYSLDTEEGITLMCLAEALLRIPDSETADALIEDKLSSAEWDKHLSKSDSLFVNASTWGLMLSGKVTRWGKKNEENPGTALGRLIDRLGEPVIRTAMNQAMKIMGKQFVLGRTIKEALNEADDDRKLGYTHSFDMLGEAAITAADATRYYQSYYDAISALGAHHYKGDAARPNISIKLSALHPRYEESQRERVLSELYETVVALVAHARHNNVQVTIDAEEMDRLELSLHLFKKVLCAEVCQDWNGFGLVVQAYASRALPVLHWIHLLAKAQKKTIPVRLVKGAYWDSEIKLAQQMGLTGYPVFTRKANTDVSYLACANYLLATAHETIYPQFATHNAQTVLSILSFAKAHHNHRFEFQRLHGMGEELYNEVLTRHPELNCRIYAPVGAHKDLLPYLVRRLLENGANTSFVHKLIDPKTPVSQLAVHPVREVRQYASFYNTAIAKPTEIFANRQNSAGLNLHIACQREPFIGAVRSHYAKTYDGASIVDGKTVAVQAPLAVNSPYNLQQAVGTVSFADDALLNTAIASAKQSWQKWSKRPTSERAAVLDRIADLFETNQHELIALCTREAGKTLQDGIDEVREAVDFCRYYANEALKNWPAPTVLPGPTGETNELHMTGRGVFFCVSPWNFPLAIFTGQVVAALVTGNAVLAKPAEPTNLIAYRAVQLMHEAGVPTNVLHLICGKGSVIGQQAMEDVRVDGVCFTGSTATARRINQTLANREGPIVPLIAETGGQNAMIVDSTSLPEQVVKDVIESAFTSAGQRCSALRVLYLQEEIADRTLALLQGAMAELRLGNPEHYQTDVGSVIENRAQVGLQAHLDEMGKTHTLRYQTPLSDDCPTDSYFIQPTVIEIDGIAALEKEQFGPILHVIRFKRQRLEDVIAEINSTGYGLTFGIHSRNETFYEAVARKIDAGNIYINRNQIGAIVGVNPFGGHGLSGTGPKAGGPHYLMRFINEKTISNNITAIGGNATLLAMGEQ
ncbi:bifunctional proline dehydrogenase/L-glutamate gamma-semialdehyde dehydrogenase PutA [Ostreibacterium oceani]|uniref:Bifunctional protein PutA n=1 Tax=Ostreibacterium oceani TaxID=2654998 RepID=A0A6N7F4L0_9GAMM|nr:bifunctional proline dehydrogenase/L-glutamate gamma-semialdehyde dehydrogenase PutA [Ostreibacterium oceani]MPV86826.1 bifunctional proline dehydrogenase/L-glutamate gamma-semialdehyde dehydrogenase PutA [Ostreibacterium oceani]